MRRDQEKRKKPRSAKRCLAIKIKKPDKIFTNRRNAFRKTVGEREKRSKGQKRIFDAKGTIEAPYG